MVSTHNPPIDEVLLRGGAAQGVTSRFLRPTFHESYQEAVEKFSQLPFIHCYGIRGEYRAASFSEFHEDVKRAAQLLEASVPPTAVLAVVCENKYDDLAFMVAGVLTGRTLCPMNPDEGVERISMKLKSLQTPYSLWVSEGRTELDTLGGLLLKLPTGPAPEELQYRPIAPDQAMVLIFTSGSTGYSKVVEQLEPGILSNVDALIERHSLAPGIRIATPLPVFHVNALEFSFFCSLLSGATLVLMERFVLPLAFVALEKEKCQIFSIVPPILRTLLERTSDLEKYDLSGLSYIVSAAAPLSVDLTRACLEKLKIPVVQGYGLSEAVNFSALMPVNLKREEYLHWMTDFPWPSIGTALRGNEVLVVREDGSEAQEGEVGEVCIRGKNVMKGYRGDHELEVFSGSMLHTGDLGMFQRDASGTAYFFITGRKKETLKRYGLTISLREIDDLVSKFDEPGFDAIAVPFQHRWSGEEVGLVAKRIPSWNASVEKRLEEFIQSRLPFHLRPKLVILTQAPLRTASGKPCRWALQPLFDRFQEVNMGPQLRFLSDT